MVETVEPLVSKVTKKSSDKMTDSSQMEIKV